jgi:hypothetical protein
MIDRDSAISSDPKIDNIKIFILRLIIPRLTFTMDLVATTLQPTAQIL